jgi:hypothetical protein
MPVRERDSGVGGQGASPNDVFKPGMLSTNLRPAELKLALLSGLTQA